MVLSRLITGLILIGFGIFVLVLDFGSFITWIYSGVFVILGLFILFNKKEDEIEKIKSKGGKKKK